MLCIENVSRTLLNSAQSNFSTSLYHFARFSLASSGLELLLNISVSFMQRLYPSWSLGNFSKRIVARAACCSFHLLRCFRMICLLLLSICGRVSPLFILSGSHFPISSLSCLFLAAFFFWRCALIARFSASRTSRQTAASYVEVCIRCCLLCPLIPHVPWLPMHLYDLLLLCSLGSCRRLHC